MEKLKILKINHVDDILSSESILSAFLRCQIKGY